MRGKIISLLNVTYLAVSRVGHDSPYGNYVSRPKKVR